jgi:hypothetical protein
MVYAPAVVVKHLLACVAAGVQLQCYQGKRTMLWQLDVIAACDMLLDAPCKTRHIHGASSAIPLLRDQGEAWDECLLHCGAHFCSKLLHATDVHHWFCSVSCCCC